MSNRVVFGYYRTLTTSLITLLISITLFCGLTILCKTFPTLRLNVGNILHNIVNPLNINMDMNNAMLVKNQIYSEKIYVRDDPKLLGGSGEVPIYEWSGWRFVHAVKSSLYLTGKS
jgi:hypothetical protein